MLDAYVYVHRPAYVDIDVFLHYLDSIVVFHDTGFPGSNYRVLYLFL